MSRSEMSEQELVNYVEAHGVNVKLSEKKGATPLMVAAQAGYLTAVNAFLAKGANVNAISDIGDGSDTTALLLAAEVGRVEVVRVLIAAGATVNVAPRTDNLSPLFLAAQNGHAEVVSALITGGAGVNAARKDGVTPLLMAARNGHIKVVRALLAVVGIDVDKRAFVEGITALCIAAEHGHSEVVSALIAARADVNAERDDGVTPLLIAAQNGHAEVVKLLLTVEDIDLYATHVKSGYTALSAAGWRGHYGVVKLLAKHLATEVIKENSFNESSMFARPSNKRRVEAHSRLLKVLDGESGITVLSGYSKYFEDELAKVILNLARILAGTSESTEASSAEIDPAEEVVAGCGVPKKA